MQIRRSRRGSPLARLGPGLAWVLVFGTTSILVILLYVAVWKSASHSNNINSSNSGSTVLRRAAAQSDVTLDSPQQHSSIISHGALTCPEAKHKVATEEWPDPNHGRIYARETITHPTFRISLHNQEYDPVRWKIMEEGKYYEDDVHERFVQILQSHKTTYVLDVGANIGYYTLLSVALGHNVISFEPNPGNILRLCDSLRLNDWSQRDVHIFQHAVSNVHGEEMLLYAPRNPGQAFLKPIEEQQEVDTNEHQAKTTLVSLDKFAEEQGWLDRKKKDFEITLLKVDVEGKEPQVIMGAPRLLASGLVKNVLTEGRRFGRKNLLDSFVVLFEAGFTLKEPAIPKKGSTALEHAQGVVEYYKEKLGENSQRTQDLWWVKE